MLLRSSSVHLPLYILVARINFCLPESAAFLTWYKYLFRLLKFFVLTEFRKEKRTPGGRKIMKLFVLFSLSFGAPLQKPHSEVIIVYGTFSTSH